MIEAAAQPAPELPDAPADRAEALLAETREAVAGAITALRGDDRLEAVIVAHRLSEISHELRLLPAALAAAARVRTWDEVYEAAQAEAIPEPVTDLVPRRARLRAPARPGDRALRSVPGVAPLAVAFEAARHSAVAWTAAGAGTAATVVLAAGALGGPAAHAHTAHTPATLNPPAGIYAAIPIASPVVSASPDVQSSRLARPSPSPSLLPPSPSPSPSAPATPPPPGVLDVQTMQVRLTLTSPGVYSGTLTFFAEGGAVAWQIDRLGTSSALRFDTTSGLLPDGTPGTITITVPAADVMPGAQLAVTLRTSRGQEISVPVAGI